MGADGTVYFGSADQTFYALRPDGTVRWSVPTGGIIDSAGLLDDRGKIYFGSGDGILRAANAQSGAIAWTMHADDPSTGRLVHRLVRGERRHRQTGDALRAQRQLPILRRGPRYGAPVYLEGRYARSDLVAAAPSIDPKTGTLYIGNNNLLPLFGDNTFAIPGRTA